MKGGIIMLYYKRFSLCLFVLLLVFSFIGYAPVEALEPVNLTFACSSPGRAGYARAAILTEIIKEGLPSGSNVRLLTGIEGMGDFVAIEADKAQLAVVFSLHANWCFLGTHYWEGKPLKKITALLGDFGPYPYALIVQEDLDAKTFDEIIEKKMPISIVVPGVDNLTDNLFNMILDEYNVTREDIKAWGGKIIVVTMAEGISIMEDGDADMIVTVIPPGHPGTTELTQSRSMRFLPLSESVLDEIIRNDDGIEKTVVPIGTFRGITEPYPTLLTSVILVGSSNIDEETAYLIVKALIENMDELRTLDPLVKDFDVEKAVLNTGVLLHPGAKRYFQEIGVLK